MPTDSLMTNTACRSITNEAAKPTSCLHTKTGKGSEKCTASTPPVDNNGSSMCCTGCLIPDKCWIKLLIVCAILCLIILYIILNCNKEEDGEEGNEGEDEAEGTEAGEADSDQQQSEGADMTEYDDIDSSDGHDDANGSDRFGSHGGEGSLDDESGLDADGSLYGGNHGGSDVDDTNSGVGSDSEGGLSVDTIN